MTTAPPLAGSDIYLTDELLDDEERAVRDRVRDRMRARIGEGSSSC